MVLVRVFDAEEPAVAERVSVGDTVSVAERERLAVSVGEGVAPGRERVEVVVAVGVGPGRERVAVAVTVGETVAPARERVAVAVPETVGAAARDRETVEETEIAGARDRVAVSVTEPDTVTACERDAVALMVPTPPPPEDGMGTCAHPDETAKAKKKSLRIIFAYIILTACNFFLFVLYYLRADCFHELPHAVH